MNIVIRNSDHTPIYQQIYQQLKDQTLTAACSRMHRFHRFEILQRNCVSALLPPNVPMKNWNGMDFYIPSSGKAAL